MERRKAKLLDAGKAEHSFYRALQAVAERVLILFILVFMGIRLTVRVPFLLGVINDSIV
jgi:hypothetical protein